MSGINMNPDTKRTQISINDELFKLPLPTEEPRLIGAKCRKCNEIFFPKKNRCISCFNDEMEEVALSKKGKIYSYTIVHHKTPDYSGPLPYAVGAVELPEGIVILSPLTQCDLANLKVGIDVELVLEKLYDDEDGNEVISYKFTPC